MQPLLLACAALALPQEDPPAWSVPDGAEVSVWSESPLVFNPTAIDVDARGRLWVTEAVNYRKWDGRNPGREHPRGDRVVVLEDTDRDGTADRSTVFAQDLDLVSPLGIAVVGERVYVSASPHVLVYEDTDGDLVADRREVFLTGFGGFDHDHGVHSVVPGPDGRLWLAVGNAGPHLVTDRDGWTLRSGSLYVGGGPRVADNKPALVSDDGRVWTGGLVLSVEHDATGLEVFAHNFRNEYEVALDAFGRVFTADNDDDGNRGCRTLEVVRGGNHGFFSTDGSRTWQADRRPGQTTPRAHWHQDDPGVMPAGTINGAGGPTGVCVYESELLGEQLRGAVLNADAGAGVVYAHLPHEDGAGVALDRTEFLRPAGEREDESARWFRPSDVAVGPGGVVYVADWYDPGVGGHLAGDREAYGRILRVAPAGHAAGIPEVDLESPDGALDALASPVAAVRELGRAALAEGGAESLATLRKALGTTEDDALRARIAWILAASHDHGPGGATGVDAPSAVSELADTLGALLRDADPRMRVIALAGVGLRRRRGELADPAAFPPKLARGLANAVHDPSARVRREVLTELRGHELATDAGPLFRALAAAYDGEDRVYLEAFGLAAEGREGEVYAALVTELGDVPARWDARFEGLAWRLHPRAAVPAWVARAGDEGLSAQDRRRAVDALAFTPGREAAESVALLAQTGPEDVRPYATWWVRHRDANDWRAYDLAAALRSAALEDTEIAWSSGEMRAGTATVDVDVTGAETVWLVVADAGDGNSCDWADWIEPRFVTGDGEVPLRELAWLEAEAAWGEVRVDANCAGGELAVGERLNLSGLGTHANSRVAYAVPEGARRFRAEVGPDRGGTDQAGGRATSIAFEVRLERAPDPDRWAALEARALDASLSAGERRAAAEELARDPRGALRWLARAAETGVDEPIAGWVAGAIFTNPDVGVRALASEHFSRPGGGADLPPVAELAALEGDPRRGRALFRDRERVQCVQCHAFELDGARIGGDVGPELTRIGEKYGPEALLDSILNPSAGIALGYESWVVRTVDGGLLAGFLLADGDVLVIQDTAGERHVVPAEYVEARARQTVSTMPDGAALGLGAQELADLAAFLRSSGARRVTEGEPVELFDGRSLAGWTSYSTAGRAEAEGTWSVRDGVLACTGSPAGYLATQAEYESFHLEVEWRFDPAKGAGNSGVLLRVQRPDEVWPRSIEAQLHSGNAGDLWNIGEFGMEVDDARTRGRRTVRLQPSSERSLGEWNRYDIRLEGPRLELRVNGVLQNVADWCEERPGRVALQSEGAPIEFRRVRLTPLDVQ